MSAPVWERYIGFGAVAFILFGLLIGGIEIVRMLRASRRYDTNPRKRTLPAGMNPAALAFALIALLYPIMQLFRLTTSGKRQPFFRVPVLGDFVCAGGGCTGDGTPGSRPRTG
ncbi:MAG: hypothetical protein U0670_08250 [Anaerolineae bacterium]